MIYLDNAATTMQKPPGVAEAVAHAVGALGNSARGAHGGSLDAARTIYTARELIAALFHCPRPDHVIFTSNVTEALNIAIYGLIGEGDHVVTTALEHNSVLRPLFRLREERHIRLDIVPADRQGRLDYDELERRTRPDTRAVVCTHASNLTGTPVDAARVAAAAHRNGAYLILDTAQTAGTRPLDMLALGADVLCFTGHKGLMGPQGTGGMCVREGVPIRPLIVGGTGVQTYRRAQPEELPVRLEAGTRNGPGIAGLSAAVQWLQSTGLEHIAAREAALTRRFLDAVRGIPGLTLYGAHEADSAAIVALDLDGWDPGELADALYTDHDIAVRAGAHCAPLMHEALGTRGRGAVRFSFSYFTSEEDIDAAVRALDTLARE